jgi:hypothetical protein
LRAIAARVCWCLAALLAIVIYQSLDAIMVYHGLRFDFPDLRVQYHLMAPTVSMTRLNLGSPETFTLENVRFPPAQEVFRTRAAFAKFFRERWIDAGREDRDEPSNLKDPGIDFAASEIILGSPGGRDGHQVDIIRVEERSDDLLVHSVEWIPYDDFTFAMITYPVSLVVVPRSTKPVHFAPMFQSLRRLRPLQLPWARTTE